MNVQIHRYIVVVYDICTVLYERVTCKSGSLFYYISKIIVYC